MDIKTLKNYLVEIFNSGREYQYHSHDDYLNDNKDYEAYEKKAEKLIEEIIAEFERLGVK